MLSCILFFNTSTNKNWQFGIPRVYAFNRDKASHHQSYKYL